MPSFPESSTSLAAEPVWLVLASPVPDAPNRSEAVVVNVGNGSAVGVTVRHVPGGGLGPALAEVDRVDPEAEVTVVFDRCDAGEDTLLLEWSQDGRRRRRQIDLVG